MINRYSIWILLVLLMVSSSLTMGQRRTSTSRQANHTTITARSGEQLSSVAARANVAADELAQANGLAVDTRLRKGQRLIIPTPSTATASVRQSGEIVGKRIIFIDGGKLDVDDVWKQGEATWFRLNGTSQTANGAIRSIEDRYKDIPAPAPLAPPVNTATKKVEKQPVVTWIYLADGARFRVDEVREVADGAWYNRGNLAIFLDKARIARIEREEADAGGNDWKEHGWSSGSGLIDQLIRTNASRFGIDPYLVFLVIEQESHFRPRIVSPKGAQGLMQLMPGTARRFGVSRPFDAGDNIRGGTQYLKELLSMFNGRVDLALASYNAGEGRVLDYGNRVPPFKETREYVRRISSRYNGPKPKATLEPTLGRRP
jgi:soluble lytic murein transglycosylase-like protein